MLLLKIEPLTMHDLVILADDEQVNAFKDLEEPTHGWGFLAQLIEHTLATCDQLQA